MKLHRCFEIAVLLLLIIGTTSCGAVTPVPTPTPVSIESEIKQLLQDNNCQPPCFLGIVPEQTTVDELETIFTRYKVPLHKGSFGYSNLREPYNQQLIPYTTFSIRESKVHSILIDLGTTNEFVLSLYSPTNVLKRFGTPSKVEFGLTNVKHWLMQGRYTMKYYYDNLDLVIQYFGLDVSLGEQITVCPNRDEFDSTVLSLGKDPDILIGNTFNVPLEEVTSFTLESFQEYMFGPAACFDLKGTAWKVWRLF